MFRPSGVAVAADSTVYLDTDGVNGGTDTPAVLQIRPRQPPKLLEPAGAQLPGANGGILGLDAAPGGRLWVVTRAHCGQGWCVELSSMTAHGFSSPIITNVPAGTAPNCSGSGCLAGASNLVFANTTDGYLWGPDLYATVNGGRTWRKLDSNPVASLAVDDGTVVRAAYLDGGCPGPCGLQLQTARVGANRWQSLPTAAGLGSAAGIQLIGSPDGPVYALAPANLAKGDNNPSQLLHINLPSRTVTTLANPCPAHSQVEALAANRSTLAALCEGYSTGYLTVSDTVGNTFQAAQPVPTGNDGQIATSDGTVYLASGPIAGSGTVRYLVVSSTDNGQRWQHQLQGTETLPALGGDNVALVAAPGTPAAFASTATRLRVLTGTRHWTSFIVNPSGRITQAG
ncbi:MAG: hypothetical protein ACYCUG_01890 [Acidimicrobiales bacterium]